MPPRYRYPARITLSILRDFILGRKRSFAADAARLKEGISRLEITGDPPHGAGPYLFLVNHYSRPGFQAWWIAITLTSATGRVLHWPMTSAWTFPDPLRACLITPLTEWALARFARMYSFTLMPPMPPREMDVEARADSVRRILRLARREKPSIGMAPEGMDSPDGRLMQPPSGAGRFISHLENAGYTLIPVGFFESGDACRLRFGAPFELPRNLPADPEARDREAGKIVIGKISELLPENLT
jgi:1-acyl-sn-glycerol-3-phosphate acyltransferase